MKKNKKKQIIRIVLFVGTITSLFFVPWILVKVWLTPLPNSIQEQVNTSINYGFDGIIVYVQQKENQPKFYAAGYHNRKSKTPVNPHALFKIASIGKLYDAVAVSKLVAKKQLDLNQNLAYYFPELVGRIENATTITLKMLIQHRSGIPNFTNTPNFWINPPKTPNETLKRILDLPANFQPDQKYEYSNTNYLLISNLIEKVVGYSKFQFIKEEILNPLQLKHTFGSINDVNLDDVMSGYYVGVEEDIKTTNYGSMLATAEDVGIFIRALNDGSLFENNEREIYTSLYKLDHTGLIPGYQSIAKYHQAIDTVVIQFVNTTNFDGYTWSLGEMVYSRIVKVLKNQNEL